MNALDILKYGHQTVLRTLEGLPPTEWETPDVCGIWSVKDIMAHLASYEHLLVEVLNSLLGSEQTPLLEKVGKLGFEGFNDSEVALRQGKSASEVLAEYQDIQTKTMALAAQIPLEMWPQTGALAWYGPEYALDDFIVYSYYGHKREHSAQIAVFCDQLAR